MRADVRTVLEQYADLANWRKAPILLPDGTRRDGAWVWECNGDPTDMAHRLLESPSLYERFMAWLTPKKS